MKSRECCREVGSREQLGRRCCYCWLALASCGKQLDHGVSQEQRANSARTWCAGQPECERLDVRLESRQFRINIVSSGARSTVAWWSKGAGRPVQVADSTSVRRVVSRDGTRAGCQEKREEAADSVDDVLVESWKKLVPVSGTQVRDTRLVVSKSKVEERMHSWERNLCWKPGDGKE